MTTAHASPVQRFTPAQPCPICGNHERLRRGQGVRCHGYTVDGWAYCTREEYAGGAPFADGASAWRHRLTGDCRCGLPHGAQLRTETTPTPRTPRRKTRESRPAGKIVAVYDLSLIHI